MSPKLVLHGIIVDTLNIMMKDVALKAVFPSRYKTFIKKPLKWLIKNMVKHLYFLSSMSVFNCVFHTTKTRALFLI